MNLFSGKSLRLTRITTQCVLKPEIHQRGARLYQFRDFWRYNTVDWQVGAPTRSCEPPTRDGYHSLLIHTFAFARMSWHRFIKVCRIPTLAP